MCIGCRDPVPPSESILKCARGVGSCFVKCKSGHAFPSGATKTVLKCELGEWFDQRAGQGQPVPDCLPVCDSPCRNQGICVRPNVCYCQVK